MSNEPEVALGQEEAQPKRGGNNKMSVEDVTPELPPEGRTRRSRIGGSGDDFEIPVEWKKPGWAYVWWEMKIAGLEVDHSRHVEIADGGYEAVRPQEMPRAVPAGYKANTIDRKGLRLYRRPKYLEDQAIAEDLLIAQQQKQAKLAQAYSSGQGEAQRVVQTMDISVKAPGS